MSSPAIKLFLVDDDALFLKSLEIDLAQENKYSIETFATGEACIKQLSKVCDIVILDYHLDSIDKNAMNGIDTLDKIKAYNPKITVIMLSSQDKIDVAIHCMHHKAHDYVVKSETSFFRLQKIIDTLIEHKKIEEQLNWYMNHM